MGSYAGISPLFDVTKPTKLLIDGLWDRKDHPINGEREREREWERGVIGKHLKKFLRIIFFYCYYHALCEDLDLQQK